MNLNIIYHISSVKDKKAYYTRIIEKIKGGISSEELLERLGIDLSSKLSSGNQNPVHYPDELLLRLASMLCRVVHNPRGSKYFQRHYSKKLRGRSLKPTTVRPAGGSHIRKIMRYLVQNELAIRHKKGIYASEKAKKIILSSL